jgi:hypothetical protein
MIMAMEIINPLDLLTPNKNVIHPERITAQNLKGVNKFNDKLAVTITKSVGTMWTGYLFALLSLFSLPAILHLVFPKIHIFPHWIISASLISLIAWLSQNFLQLVLLPVIMVGQNVIQGQQDAKAEADHKTLTYLANLQEKQVAELNKQTIELKRIAEVLKSRDK